MDSKYFLKLTKEEVKEFFNNYIKESPKQIDILTSKIEEWTNGECKKEEYDYSPESLIKLWKIVKFKMRIVSRLPEEDIEVPKWVRESSFYESKKFTYETKVLIIRVAYYLAEVLLRNNHQLQWGVGELDENKNYLYANRPVIQGFKGESELSPIDIIEVSAYKLAHGNVSDEQLYNTYKIWVEEYL